MIGRVLFGFTVHGAENVPKTGPLILASNHSQYADPVLVNMAVPRRVQWMGKKELFVFPFGKFFRFIGTFPVDRQSGGRAALRAALDYLADGWTLGIFPEGTHRNHGISRDAKSGVVMLSTRGNAPVLPIYMSRIPNLAQRMRGAKLHAYIGEPMTTDNTTRGGRAYREAADEILRTIYALPEKHAKEVGDGS
ncbi:MAG TPA: lysophospholipid acyltransferase family protein [Rubrobacteraceae bacterium]|nr:lysophospholipid acyltransferase family protein [Rubrobacteraceae bacterium]